jgi:hypothetical protein
VICSVVRGEILYGLARLPDGRRRDDLTKQAEPLFATIACEAVRRRFPAIRRRSDARMAATLVGVER